MESLTFFFGEGRKWVQSKRLSKISETLFAPCSTHPQPRTAYFGYLAFHITSETSVLLRSMTEQTMDPVQEDQVGKKRGMPSSNSQPTTTATRARSQDEIQGPAALPNENHETQKRNASKPSSPSSQPPLKKFRPEPDKYALMSAGDELPTDHTLVLWALKILTKT